MRILMFNWRDLANPASGGAEVYTDAVLSRWAEHGHDVTLFCAQPGGLPDNEEVHGYQIVRRGNRFGVYKAAKRWYTQHGRGQFDVVIDQVNTHPFFAHEYVDDAKVYVFCHQIAKEVWGYETPWPASWFGRYVLEPRWLRRLSGQRVLTESESTRESLDAYGVRDITILPMGIDEVPEVQKVAGIDNEKPTVIFCGRLVASKRPDEAIRAFGLVRERRGDARMWVIGDGPMRARLEQGAPPGVEFLGRVSQNEKHARMAAADAIIVTSVREGWGLIVSEAAAVGTGAVTYDVAGLRDSVQAADGVLCEATPEALAQALDGALTNWRQNPREALKHGGAASWDDVAHAMMVEITRDRVNEPICVTTPATVI